MLIEASKEEIEKRWADKSQGLKYQVRFPDHNIVFYFFDTYADLGFIDPEGAGYYIPKEGKNYEDWLRNCKETIPCKNTLIHFLEFENLLEWMFNHHQDIVDIEDA